MKVFSLDTGGVVMQLRTAAARLADRYPEVQEVRLFGSLARGDAGPGSDADVLVVLSEAGESFIERGARYALTGCGIGVDMFAYTRSELERLAEERPRFYRAMVDAGVALFQR